MPSPADAAIRKLEQLMSRDPMLRDVFVQSMPRSRTEGRFSPEIDVLELEDRYVVHLEVPGVARGDLDVQVLNGRLTVTGTKSIPRPAGATTRVSERRGGPFKREFLLPGAVEVGAIRAALTDGVLTVTLPRRPEDGSHKVEIG